MPRSELIAQTSLSTALEAPPTLLSLNKRFKDLVSDGEIVKAIRLYRYTFFHTTLSLKSDKIKKSMLRSLWRAVEIYYEQRFEMGLESQKELLHDCSDSEWAECEQNGLLGSAIDHVLDDERIERQENLKFGGSIFMVNAMCAPGGTLSEEWLVFVESELA